MKHRRSVNWEAAWKELAKILDEHRRHPKATDADREYAENYRTMMNDLERRFSKGRSQRS